MVAYVGVGLLSQNHCFEMFEFLKFDHDNVEDETTPIVCITCSRFSVISTYLVQHNYLLSFFCCISGIAIINILHDSTHSQQ